MFINVILQWMGNRSTSRRINISLRLLGGHVSIRCVITIIVDIIIITTESTSFPREISYNFRLESLCCLDVKKKNLIELKKKFRNDCDSIRTLCNHCVRVNRSSKARAPKPYKEFLP
jgi:hypothetical protein